MIRLSLTPLVAATAAVLLLAGCTPPNPTPTPTETASASASETPTPTPTPDPTTAFPPHTTDDPCLREVLDMTYTATDNSAGAAHGILTMTNTSSTVCSIEGFPTVWFDNPEAQQPMGAAASKDTTATPVVAFDLLPGASTTSQVTITEAGFVDGCNVVDSIAFLVIPPLPGEVSDWSQYVRHLDIDATPACTNDEIGLITVTAMVPAA